MTRFTAFVLLALLLAIASGCKKKPDDNALAQGEWVVQGIDAGDDGDGPRPDELRDVSIAIQGNRATISHAKEKGSFSANFVLDQTKSPREIDLTDVTLTDVGQDQKMPGTTRGIYKFNGDELIVSLSLGLGKDLPRPTEFKPSTDRKGGSGILVLTLKRK